MTEPHGNMTQSIHMGYDKYEYSGVQDENNVIKLMPTLGQMAEQIQAKARSAALASGTKAHFEEDESLDNDVDIPAEQIVPTNLLANYLICYLGPGRFQQQIHIDVFMLDLLQFYKKIENKMPYKWGDKKLAIGNLPLGELVDKNVDISPLNKYKYVHSWTCK